MAHMHQPKRQRTTSTTTETTAWSIDDDLKIQELSKKKMNDSEKNTIGMEPILFKNRRFAVQRNPSMNQSMLKFWMISVLFMWKLFYTERRGLVWRWRFCRQWASDWKMGRYTERPEYESMPMLKSTQMSTRWQLNGFAIYADTKTVKKHCNKILTCFWGFLLIYICRYHRDITEWL